jgi:hypothetical protein
MSLLELWLPVAAAWFVLWLFSEDKTPLGEVRLGTLGIWIFFTVIVVITLSFVCGLVLLLGKTFLSNYPRDDSSIFFCLYLGILVSLVLFVLLRKRKMESRSRS